MHMGGTSDPLFRWFNRLIKANVSRTTLLVTRLLTHSRRDLFRVFDIGFGQIEGILGIILAT